MWSCAKQQMACASDPQLNSMGNGNRIEHVLCGVIPAAPGGCHHREDTWYEPGPGLLDQGSKQHGGIDTLIESTSRVLEEVLGFREALRQTELRIVASLSEGCRVPSQPFSETPLPISSQARREGENPATVESGKGGGAMPPSPPRLSSAFSHQSFNRIIGPPMTSCSEDIRGRTLMNVVKENPAPLRTLDSTHELLDFAYDYVPDKPRHSVTLKFFSKEFQFHDLLDKLGLALVILNFVFTCVQMDETMAEMHDNTPQTPWYMYVDAGFSIAFATEVCLRMKMLGTRLFFCTGQDTKWNILDCFFVCSSAVPWAVESVDLSYIRAVRILRVLRAFRAVRGLRFVRTLRLMLASILACASSFMWCLFLLFFFIFLAALCLMQGLAISLEGSEDKFSQSVFDLYGTVGRASYSFFLAISGGQSWVELVDPLEEIGPVYRVFMCLYIAVVLFGIMNVLTAVFCENSLRIATVDKDLLIQDEVQRAKEDHRRIKKCFSCADRDGDGKLSARELEEYLMSPERRAALSLMSIDANEIRGLFQMMDGAPGEVDIDAFVDCIVILQGSAKGCDAALLMYENKRLLIRLVGFMCFTCDNFRVLFSALRCEHAAPQLDSYLDQETLDGKEAEAKATVNSNFRRKFAPQTC